ncbi:stonustoxin subunit alpha-like [Scleropages formosus]|uniref:stonustoxin subunit alpha-like n=1 Tax=Scleropages formosus TaxID=113540 RepID=UPI0010FA97C0|nr:stonustoxin subunit alpha-like [Scleropages formosus]
MSKQYAFPTDACYLTLDTNTANEYLSLSVGKREIEVKSEWKSQVYLDHPERFDHCPQVLCRQGLSGCCYWEVKWTGSNGVHIAVSYKGTSRKGNRYDSHLGYNDKSWALHCSPYNFYFRYNNNEIPVEVPVPGPSTIGVYLDHRAGTLSFYSVSRDTVTLLHRVQTTFTEPLYPGFHVCALSSLKLYFGKHKLLNAVNQLQEEICSHHDKVLEIYPSTDQQCICYQRVMDEHRGHAYRSG